MPQILQSLVFNDPYSRALLACGRLRTEDKSLLEIVAGVGERRIVTRVGTEPHAEYVTFFAGGEGGANHVHVNVMRSSYYQDGEPPKLSEDAGEVGRILHQLYGQQIGVWVTGRFIVPLKDVPPTGLIKTTRIRAEVGGLKIRQNSASFKVEGGPVKAVSWSFEKAEDGSRRNNVRIQLELLVDAQLDDRYLATLQAVSFGAFKNIVLGGDSNADR